MVEYAVLLAQTTLTSFGAFASSAEMWLGRLNWQVIGYTALGLLALRVAAWALRTR
jgi:hypothetical protein